MPVDAQSAKCDDRLYPVVDTPCSLLNEQGKINKYFEVIYKRT